GPVANLLKTGRRHRTGGAGIEEHERAVAVDSREGVPAPVDRQALVVENALEALERIPEHEHPRVGERLGCEEARRARARVVVRPDLRAGRPCLLNRVVLRTFPARAVLLLLWNGELSVEAVGEDCPDVEPAVSLQEEVGYSLRRGVSRHE